MYTLYIIMLITITLIDAPINANPTKGWSWFDYSQGMAFVQQDLLSLPDVRSLIENLLGVRAFDLDCREAKYWKPHLVTFCNDLITRWLTQKTFGQLGDSRKYPYPPTDGFHILTPQCLRKFQNALPLHALGIP